MKKGDLVKLQDSESIYTIYKLENTVFTNQEIATIYLHKGDLDKDKVKLEVYTEELIKA